MKKVMKYVIILVFFLIVAALSIVSYVKLALPDIALEPDIQVDITPARVERGKYLAHHVAVCMDCHSTRDWSQFAGPMVPGNLGGGGQRFGKEMGFPGTFYAPNITPYALKDWTDAEIFRAITSGVDKHGKAMLPLMPYPNYGKMDREDIYDIIAYIRTIPAVVNNVQESKADFPVSILINTMPSEATLTKKPFADERIAYGKYLVAMAGCADCHSKVDKGAVIAGTEFGGGREFSQPAGTVRSSNITSDRETGIGSWSMETFVKQFKKYTDTAFLLPRLGKEDINSPMPWTMYADMKEEDLQAIYMYLNSLQPISNKVIRYEKHSANQVNKQ